MKKLLGLISALALVFTLPISAGAAGAAKPAPAPLPAQAVQPAPAPAPAPEAGGVSVGVGDLKISGIFQTQFKLWQEMLPESGDTQWRDAFIMKRARIFLMGSIMPNKVKYVFQGDAVNALNIGSYENVEDAFGDANLMYFPSWLLDARIIFVNVLPNTEIQVGRFLPNFTYYQPQLVSKLDFIEYPLLTSKYAMWRQVGIQSTTKFGASSLNVGIYNSIKTQNTWIDNDNWKDFLVRLNVKPADQIESAVYTVIGRTAVAGTDNYHTNFRVGAFLRATPGQMNALVELLYALDESDPDNVNGLSLFGQLGYKVVPKVEPMIRVEYQEPNFDGDSDEIIRLTGGVVYYVFGQNAMLSLNIIEDLKDPENLFQLNTQAQVAF